jgi:adenosylcobinamide-GDP ribazoletransferase
LSALRSPRAALAFLTPIGGAAEPTPGAVAWFPVVGAGLGGLLGYLWWLTEHIWPVGVAAALVLAADLALTGLLHLDGLVDAADGLLPHLTRVRRLEVMAEPTVGAFGIGVAGLLLLARFAALASTHPSVVLLVGVWCGSRTVMAVAATVLPYARQEAGGLASAFRGLNDRRPGLVAGVLGTAGTLACLLVWRPLGGAVVFVAALVGAGGVLWLAVRRLGGFTGDVLGAAGVVFETVALVVASARWS